MSYTYDYPRPMLTVDIVLFSGLDDDAHILLVKRGNEPFKGLWALPGGFMELDETTQQAAQRELMEETGLECPEMMAHSVQDAIDRDPRGRTLSVIYVGVLEDEMPDPQAGDDAIEAKWFHHDDLPELAFDHANILSEVINDYGFRDGEFLQGSNLSLN
jgi:8-oxo-dGTP diphosphatase